MRKERNYPKLSCHRQCLTNRTGLLSIEHVYSWLTVEDECGYKMCGEQNAARNEENKKWSKRSEGCLGRSPVLTGRNVMGSPVRSNQTHWADRGWSSTEMQNLVSRGGLTVTLCSSDDCTPGAGNPGKFTPGTWRVTKEDRYHWQIYLHCYPSSIRPLQRPKRLTPAERWEPKRAALHHLHWWLWWWQEWDFSIPEEVSF